MFGAFCYFLSSGYSFSSRFKDCFVFRGREENVVFRF